MSVKQINGEDFQKEVLEDKKIVLVDFFADWCGPCQLQGPIMEEFSLKHPEIKVCKLNIDSQKENTEIAIQYGVMSIPAMIVFKDGNVFNQTIGLTEIDELETLIK